MRAPELIWSPGMAIADAASTSHALEEQQDHASLGCSLGHDIVWLGWHLGLCKQHTMLIAVWSPMGFGTLEVAGTGLQCCQLKHAVQQRRVQRPLEGCKLRQFTWFLHGSSSCNSTISSEGEMQRESEISIIACVHAAQHVLLEHLQMCC